MKKRFGVYDIDRLIGEILLHALKSKEEMSQELNSVPDLIQDITSNSQENSHFQYRWPSANLTLIIYFYLFSILYLTRKEINNYTPHIKLPKNQYKRSAIRLPAITLLGDSSGFWSTNSRPFSALVPQTLSCSVCVSDS